MMPPAGLSSGYFISAATEHPEEAERFLTFLFDPANAKDWVEQIAVIPPYAIDASTLDVSPLIAETISSLADPEAMGVNIDVLTPEAFNTTMHDGFQAVLAEDRTAEEQAAALQASMQQSQPAQ